ncbi:MAG TPA: MFS transporter [Streptosporangiaceae bacterium]|nr:MFS transporter [Streptosporangiaceae bacterium]
MPRLRQIAVNTEPLRNPDFRRLFFGQGIAFIGFQVTAVAVPVQMYAITHSSLWVGLLGVAALVPLVAFGLYGGAIADVVDRRRLYVSASCVLWAVTGAFLLQAILHARSAWILLALMAAQSTGFAVSSPVRGAIVPRLLDASLVPAGNTLNFTLSNVGTVAGPLVAGVVLARFGYAAAYAVDACLFTFGLYAALRLPALPPLAGGGRAGLRSVIDGLRFIAGRPVLALSFAFDIIANAFAMPRALFPQVAAERFGGPSAAGWLYASIAIGAVAGGLASGWISRVRRQGVALVSAVVAWGLLVAAAGLAHTLWLAVLLLAGAGAADLVSAVYRQTILQVTAPDQMRGRMQGVFIVVVAGGPRLGDLRAGVSAAAVGVTASWVGGGIACVALVLLLAIAAPALVRYQPAAQGQPDRRGRDRTTLQR